MIGRSCRFRCFSGSYGWRKQYFLDFDFDCLVNGGNSTVRASAWEHRRPGGDVAAAIIREKNRENAIRSTGRDAVRFGLG